MLYCEESDHVNAFGSTWAQVTEPREYNLVMAGLVPAIHADRMARASNVGSPTPCLGFDKPVSPAGMAAEGPPAERDEKAAREDRLASFPAEPRDPEPDPVGSGLGHRVRRPSSGARRAAVAVRLDPRHDAGSTGAYLARDGPRPAAAAAILGMDPAARIRRLGSFLSGQPAGPGDHRRAPARNARTDVDGHSHGRPAWRGGGRAGRRAAWFRVRRARHRRRHGGALDPHVLVRPHRHLRLCREARLVAGRKPLDRRRRLFRRLCPASRGALDRAGTRRSRHLEPLHARRHAGCDQSGFHPHGQSQGPFGTRRHDTTCLPQRPFADDRARGARTAGTPWAAPWSPRPYSPGPAWGACSSIRSATAITRS